jgi:hypothetical protein
VTVCAVLYLGLRQVGNYRLHNQTPVAQGRPYGINYNDDDDDDDDAVKRRKFIHKG